jgi:hypothetical protein
MVKNQDSQHLRLITTESMICPPETSPPRRLPLPRHKASKPNVTWMELSFYGFGADAPIPTLHHGIVTHRTMVLTTESYRSWVTGEAGFSYIANKC